MLLRHFNERFSNSNVETIGPPGPMETLGPMEATEPADPTEAPDPTGPMEAPDPMDLQLHGNVGGAGFGGVHEDGGRRRGDISGA